MKQLPKRSGEYLFEIILRRHEVKSTLMTSNRPLEDWGKLIGDMPSATANYGPQLPPGEPRKNLKNRSKVTKAPTESAAEDKADE